MYTYMMLIANTTYLTWSLNAKLGTLVFLSSLGRGIDPQRSRNILRQLVNDKSWYEQPKPTKKYEYLRSKGREICLHTHSEQSITRKA